MSLETIEAKTLAVLQAIGTDLKNDVLDVETLIMSGAQYAAQNIKPAIVQAVTDAMAAAESVFANDPSLDKAEEAFTNVVAALEKDGVAFIESDIKFAIEAVIQARNARLALSPAAP